MNDIKFHYVYDPNWRMVARFDDDNVNPTEEYLPQQAGLDGSGGSSYIDGLVLRQDDTDGDGTLDRRIYYCQNWRSDVVALVGAGGKLKETVSYSAYGVPNPRPAGDVDDNGSCTSTDINGLDNPPGTYDVRYDPNLDGSMDSSDSTYASNNFLGVTLGWNILSNPAIDNVRGYAGYRWKQSTSKYEVRIRVFDPHLGRWTRRDPLGYVDGMSLYEYVGSRPLIASDSTGNEAIRCNGTQANQYDEICCQWAEADSDAGGQLVCCQGRKIACVHTNNIDDKVTSSNARDILKSCLRKCEPKHCPNFNCKGVYTGSPRLNPGSRRACSECDVAKCMARCINSKCGTDLDRCIACRTWLCQVEMKEQRDKFKHNGRIWCGKCRHEQIEAIVSGIIAL